MAESKKKEIKAVRSYSLKPSNIKWIAEQAFRESTPGDRVSESELLDRLIDEARQRALSPSLTKQKKSARALDIVTVL